MNTGDLIQSCVESGAVNFVKKEPVLSAAESRQLAFIELFRDTGAKFFYCEVPSQTKREDNEPFFTFTQHQVAKFDAASLTVDAKLIWSSSPEQLRGTQEADSRFRYHLTLKQWLRYKLKTHAEQPDELWAPECYQSYVIANPAGSVPAVMPRRSQPLEYQLKA